MKNNVYVRSSKSIMNISLTRIVCLIPLIIYGLYKNGIYLYMNHYTGLFGLIRPLIYMGIGAILGALVNIIYEYIFKRSKDNILKVLFSSFHIEYGILLGCIVSINTNILVFTGVVFVLFLLSKLFKNRINIMAIIFIIIYVIQTYLYDSFSYLNLYDTSRVFSLNFMDYMIGRGQGGIATTHIILLIISFIGITITNNNKTNITLASVASLAVAFGIYAIIKDVPYETIILSNNYMFICVYILTDYVTSSYTSNGEIIYGILFGLLTLAFYPLNSYIAPFIAVIIVSLLNNLIDRIANKLSNYNVN